MARIKHSPLLGYFVVTGKNASPIGGPFRTKKQAEAFKRGLATARDKRRIRADTSQRRVVRPRARRRRR